MNDPGDSPFTADYFLRGEELKISGYTDYRWLPDETIPMAAYMKRYMGVKDGHSIYEFGCGRGYLVKALRMLAIEASGYDISEWAINNCDPAVKDHVSNFLSVHPMAYDFTVAKDVMEHLTPDQLKEILPCLWESTRKAMLIIVPLTAEDGGPYLCPRDEGDMTHKIRWSLTTWLKFLQNIDRRSVVSGSFYVPGIKQANVQYEGSCGFFKLARI